MQHVSFAGAPRRRAFCDSALSRGNAGGFPPISNPRNTAINHKEAPHEP